MNKLFDAVSELFSTLIKFTFIGWGILLLAGEVRLAALRKISHGSPRLLSFSERLTGEKLPF
jgi:hypothetical protein